MPLISYDTLELLESLKSRRRDVAVDPFTVPSIRVRDPIGDIVRRSLHRRRPEADGDKAPPSPEPRRANR